MKIYIAASVNESAAARRPQARLGYYISESGRFVSLVSLEAKQGELMVLWDNNYAGGGSAAALATQTMRELLRRGYSGLVADFEGPRTSFLSDFLAAMEGQLAAKGLSLYVPEHYGGSVNKSKVLISTAISGGSLKVRLREAVERFGTDRVVLEVERVRARFSLPARAGKGDSLTGSELRRIREHYAPACFFSNPLCAYYFTYINEDLKTSFVLFDDAVSISRKIEIGQELGIGEAFMIYAEVEDILPDIMSRLDS